MGKRTWTDEQVELLRELYSDGEKLSIIAEKVGHPIGGVTSKAIDIGLTSEFIRPNNANFKAPYQDYDWCYEHFIVKGMDYKQMAEIANTKPRTIQKWCSEKYGMNAKTYSELKHLSDTQRMLIMAGVLGDGHICNREGEPMYIESHAENQKNYLYWKYSILKDVCKHEPSLYESKIRHMNDKDYVCQPFYKFNTRILDDIAEIRSMSKSEIINSIDEFGLAVFLLDDASRSPTNWIICVADFTDEEKKLFIDRCENDFNLLGKLEKDTRYILFTVVSSRKIDAIILNNVPNSLDIVQDKILSKKKALKNAV